MKHVNTSFCFCIERSTYLRNTNIAFLVPRSGMKPYRTCDISMSDLALNQFINTLRTSLVTWLIKLIVRCFSHFVVLLTFGRVMNMELFIFSGKQHSWYIIFVKPVSSVRPASPDATNILVNMLSGPGVLLRGIHFGANSTSLLVTKLIRFWYVPVESPLCCRHRAR